MKSIHEMGKFVCALTPFHEFDNTRITFIQTFFTSTDLLKIIFCFIKKFMFKILIVTIGTIYTIFHAKNMYI